MVAAESSVTKNVGDYKIVGGCPARIIGRRKPGLIITLEPTFLYWLENDKMKKCVFAGDWVLEQAVGIQRYTLQILLELDKMLLDGRIDL